MVNLKGLQKIFNDKKKESNLGKKSSLLKMKKKKKTV